MKIVFADSFYFFALLNQDEKAHAKAMAFATAFTGKIVTMGWVLTEVADGMSRPPDRDLFLKLHEELMATPGVEVVPCSDELYRTGVALYGDRADKDWPLTDCISFAVMSDRNLNEGLTGDHHFEQAGFVALLK